MCLISPRFIAVRARSVVYGGTGMSYIGRLVQERSNSITNALELPLSCTYLSMYALKGIWLNPY